MPAPVSTTARDSRSREIWYQMLRIACVQRIDERVAHVRVVHGEDADRAVRLDEQFLGHVVHRADPSCRGRGRPAEHDRYLTDTSTSRLSCGRGPPPRSRGRGVPCPGAGVPRRAPPRRLARASARSRPTTRPRSSTRLAANPARARAARPRVADRVRRWRDEQARAGRAGGGVRAGDGAARSGQRHRHA